MSLKLCFVVDSIPSALTKSFIFNDSLRFHGQTLVTQLLAKFAASGALRPFESMAPDRHSGLTLLFSV